jgi:hypothetical protein
MRDDDFFKDTQRNAREMKGLSCEFPVLYYDFRFVNCIFTVKMDRLKHILPHTQFLPIQIWPGTGMLAVTAFEYRDTSIGPYNEVAISVPLNFPPATFVGKNSALTMLRKHIYPLYIYHLPVTTEMARDVGVYFYNYPKFLAEIEFHERQDGIEVALREENDLILKMSTKRLALNKSAPIESHTFSLGEKTVMHTLIEGRAAKFGQKILGKCGELELGSHHISDELRKLEMSTSSWIGFSAENAMSKLNHPNQQWELDSMKPVSS